MPINGQKTVTEYRGFKITEQYFIEDPFREEQNPKKKRRVNVGWSFGIYGVVERNIMYYTSWSQGLFFGEDTKKAIVCAEKMIDTLLNGKKIDEVSVVKLPEIVEE